MATPTILAEYRFGKNLERRSSPKGITLNFSITPPDLMHSLPHAMAPRSAVPTRPQALGLATMEPRSIQQFCLTSTTSLRWEELSSNYLALPVRPQTT